MDQASPQLVPRVGALIRAVGANEPDGATTTELSRATGIARPTAHRLLTALLDEGMVDRAGHSGRWLLGPEMYLLGIAAAGRYEVSDRARKIVSQLAAETGESAFLSIRRGDETVCLVREDGSFPLRSHVLHEGIRLPLGVASAGLALLSHLDDREIDDYLGRTDLTAEWGAAHAADAVRARIAETRRTGYAVNPGLLVEGSWGLGATVFGMRGEPRWALSLTGVSSRFTPERIPRMGELLLTAAHALSRYSRG